MGREIGARTLVANRAVSGPARLGHLQDNTALLLKAGDDLAHLQDNVHFLNSAAQKLARAADLPTALEHAASSIQSAAAALSDAKRY